MCVITDINNIVTSVSLIPGFDAIPTGGHVWFPIKEAFPVVGDMFIPNFDIQPWLLPNNHQFELVL